MSDPTFNEPGLFHGYESHLCPAESILSSHSAGAAYEEKRPYGSTGVHRETYVYGSRTATVWAKLKPSLVDIVGTLFLLTVSWFLFGYIWTRGQVALPTYGIPPAVLTKPLGYLMTFISTILAFYSTSWNTLLMPQVFDRKSAVYGTELDLQLLQSIPSSPALSDSNLPGFTVGQTEAGYAALNAFSFPVSLNFLDFAFNTSTGIRSAGWSRSEKPEAEGRQYVECATAYRVLWLVAVPNSHSAALFGMSFWIWFRPTEVCFNLCLLCNGDLMSSSILTWVQVIFDGGSGLAWLAAFQTTLSYHKKSNLQLQGNIRSRTFGRRMKSVVAVQGSSNIPIKFIWSYDRKFNGRSLRDILEEDQIHLIPGANLAIPVTQQTIQELRNVINTPPEEVFRWVSDEFDMLTNEMCIYKDHHS
ncbi:hypothetical protein K438DRAFT_1768731 [Mycena galopus ATCC 62051]|nr:hypothetical protein K438DRAFT_1768731 [Mycena galopus ATCC 62051]